MTTIILENFSQRLVGSEIEWKMTRVAVIVIHNYILQQASKFSAYLNIFDTVLKIISQQ